MATQSISDGRIARATARSHGLATALVAGLVATAAIFVLLAANAAVQLSHPTDEEMIARFLSHESTFAALTNRSGNVVIPVGAPGESPAAATRFYVHLREGQPEPLENRPSGSWRGPGVYVVTGDRHIKGQWYIHHNRTVVVAFAPY
jgi:hypothetical protein